MLNCAFLVSSSGKSAPLIRYHTFSPQKLLHTVFNIDLSRLHNCFTDEMPFFINLFCVLDPIPGRDLRLRKYSLSGRSIGLMTDNPSGSIKLEVTFAKYLLGAIPIG